MADIDHNSPPADRLRAAADILRERADDCYPFDGPWRHDPVRQWPVVGQIHTDNDDPHGLIAELWSSTECGQYIATVHPGVGLALADLLRVHANLWDASQAAAREAFEVFAGSDLLAVADAILGIPAARALAEHQAAHRAARGG